MTASSMDVEPQRTTSARRARSTVESVAVVISGVSAVALAPASLVLLRETLHVNCSWGIGGEWGPDGSWVCGDGIGYLGAAVAAGGVPAILLFVGLLIALVRPLRGRSFVYLMFAVISLVWAGLWTLSAAIVHTGPRPADETGWELWAVAVLPGLALCSLGLLVAAAGAVSSRPWTPVALTTGVGMIVLGTALQLGIGVATLVSAGMLVAAAASRPRGQRGAHWARSRPGIPPTAASR